jgi:molybdate transport system ATP-binding protein
MADAQTIAHSGAVMLDIHVHLRQGDFHLHAKLCSDALVTGLFGPSGAGKSTLLGIIAGLAKPEQGFIIVDGARLFCSTNRINLPPHRRRIGFVFQDAQLFPHLSVRNNLLYGYRLLKPADRQLHFDAVVELLEIGPLLAQPPHHLSGGEKQRVGLGRALLTSPRLLLLDEPLAALDERLKQQILPFLLRTRDELHLPMLYVSHSLAEINYLTNCVAVIKNGKIYTEAEAKAGAITYSSYNSI